MAMRAVFVRPCPTCGRHLEVRVELLGKQVNCLHCGAQFRATQHAGSTWQDRHIDYMLAKAKAYIDSQPLDSAFSDAR